MSPLSRQVSLRRTDIYSHWHCLQHLCRILYQTHRSRPGRYLERQSSPLHEDVCWQKSVRRYYTSEVDLLDTASAPIQKRPGRGYRTFLHIECLKFLDVARGLETPLWLDRLSDLDEGHIPSSHIEITGWKSIIPSDPPDSPSTPPLFLLLLAVAGTTICELLLKWTTMEGGGCCLSKDQNVRDGMFVRTRTECNARVSTAYGRGFSLTTLILLRLPPHRNVNYQRQNSTSLSPRILPLFLSATSPRFPPEISFTDDSPCFKV